MTWLWLTLGWVWLVAWLYSEVHPAAGMALVIGTIFAYLGRIVWQELTKPVAR